MLRVMLVGGAGGGRVLSAIERHGHAVPWVIDTDSGTTSQMSLARLAAHQGRTVWPVSVLKEVGFPARVAAGIDVILSVRSRHILPPRLLQAPRFGSYNLHHGPLPEYAGRNVVSWALYNGEVNYGVTLHKMIGAVDQGPIVSSVRFPISPDDTALTLTQHCLKAGLPLLTSLLATVERRSAPPEMTEQDMSGARYYSATAKPEMWLDWRRPSRQLLNLARACEFHPFSSPWGLPKTAYSDKTLQVMRMKAARGEAPVGEPGIVMAVDEGAALVRTGDHIVRIERFLIDGNVVNGADVVTAGERFRGPF